MSVIRSTLGYKRVTEQVGGGSEKEVSL